MLSSVQRESFQRAFASSGGDCGVSTAQARREGTERGDLGEDRKAEAEPGTKV